MSRYRRSLPQLGHDLFITDGGLETTLIFQDGIDLPFFAAFDLLKTATGTEALRRYFVRYVEIAKRRGRGFIAEAPTWRANPDWAAKLGYNEPALAEANRKAIDLLAELRARHETAQTKIVISGNLGPRGDGYKVETKMAVDEARRYHAPQIQAFAGSSADMIAAFTMTCVEEAIGITIAAQDAGMPVAISFTVETDGRLPSGMALGDAIEATDSLTDGYPAYFMVNCAHPTHFQSALDAGATWPYRIRGIRANASTRSHAELDQSTDLDAGNPIELGEQYVGLTSLLPHLSIVGGCCGTDHRHVEAVCEAMAKPLSIQKVA